MAKLFGKKNKISSSMVIWIIQMLFIKSQMPLTIYFQDTFCPFVRKNICYFFYSSVFILWPRPKGFIEKNDEKYINFIVYFSSFFVVQVYNTTPLLCKNSNFVTKDFMPFLSFLYEVHKVSMHQQKITTASLLPQYVYIRTVSS